MKIDFVAKPAVDAAVLVVLISEGGKLGPRGEALDKALSGALQRSLDLPRYKGKKGELTELLVPNGTKARRVIILGLGAAKDIAALSLREAGGALSAHLVKEFETGATLLVDPVKGSKLDEAQIGGEIALGAQLRNYRFDRFLTEHKPDKPKALAGLSVVTAHPAAAEKLMRRLGAVANGVALARDLTNEPPNELYPESFVARARKLTKLGVKVEALDEKQMAKLGLNALLAVGQGSARPPRLLVLQYNGVGTRKGDAPLAFVGKGVCFDSGGLCIKRSGAMYDMKGDMAGGAAVVGLIRALAERKAKVNVVGVVGLVENMPSGKAFKPGDIVKSLSGRTIEMIDTDAEGRLVLIDALFYTATRFKPKSIVDLATLTYSIQAALGSVFAGIFANNDDLATQLTGAGVAVGERLWRMPLDKSYDEHLESRIADIKHHAEDSESGDAPHAAAFLKQFVEDRPWAHLDIAGREFAAKDRTTCPAGGTGYAVQLLEQFVARSEGIV
jgi:leucyl aminopeptidase